MSERDIEPKAWDIINALFPDKSTVVDGSESFRALKQVLVSAAGTMRMHPDDFDAHLEELSSLYRRKRGVVEETHRRAMQ